MPCNYHLRGLAEHIKEGVRAAGGTPMEFNTIAISDGITMGTKGMKTSLVSREVIADSIELDGARLPVRRRCRAVGVRQDDPRRGPIGYQGLMKSNKKPCPDVLNVENVFEQRSLTVENNYNLRSATLWRKSMIPCI